MKLWTLKYSDTEGVPCTFWSPTQEEVLRKAVAVGGLVEIKEVELPKGRAPMAAWLNAVGADEATP